MIRTNPSRSSAPRTTLTFGLTLVLGVTLSLIGSLTAVDAATLSFDYDHSFGAVAPEGPAPYATAVFDDGNTPGTVTLTVEVAATVGEADVAELYFSLDGSLDPNDLVIARTGGDGPSAGDIDFFIDPNAFQAGGDGRYDILIDLPPPPGSQASRFNAGETLIFSLSGIGTLEAASFNFLAAPGGEHGPFLSVARFLSTGADKGSSDWVGAIPEPSSLILLALGSLGICVRRRRSTL